ncbi:MAG TPA: TonB-dependent receptor, partial [Terriglobia bacterium]|nr:TonB-dependent receptor [Terriglobia bacterium]
AQVVIHSLDGNADCTVISGSDGTFVAQNLRPGQYQVIANKEGVATSAATTVHLEAGESLRRDLTLALASDSGAANTLTRSSAIQGAPLTAREKLLLDRIDELEQRLDAMEARVAGRSAAAAGPGAASAPVLASLSPAAALSAVRMPLPAPASTPAAANSAVTPAQAAAASAAPNVPEAIQAPASAPGVDNFTPFAYGDFTWLNGTPRNKDAVLDTRFFTPEVRFDTHFMESLNQPKDHTLGGATESFRSGEFQVEQASVGGDFHWQNVRGRILFMEGLFATTTPRNDGSAGVGQWDVRGAYKYVSEAYGGYHFNVNHGLNVDAGIFVSYIGLFSYYNFDNWTYQPSYVSSNTPWFFNGLRIQWFPTNKLKIEPWIINGWQSYNEFNHHRGYGGQILYRPYEWLSFVFNNYGNGTDTLGNPARSRIHTDDSIEVRYYNRPESAGISKMAFSLTGDLGCEYGGGVSCSGDHKGGPKQAFAGWMGYNRIWWGKDKYAITYGGGRMSNPGRYLTLLPPINGADAISGSPYFTANPGDQAHMWDTTLTFQWMPREYVTWWLEGGYRHADIPYFSGRGGITPPGGNTGSPQYYACSGGGSAGTNDLTAAEAACGGGLNSVWFPDLRNSQTAVSAGIMVKF